MSVENNRGDKRSRVPDKTIEVLDKLECLTKTHDLIDENP